MADKILKEKEASFYLMDSAFLLIHKFNLQ
jgi:hypothetical protein